MEVLFRKNRNHPKIFRKKASLINRRKEKEGADCERPRATPPFFQGNPLEVANLRVGDERAGQFPEEQPSLQTDDQLITAQLGGLINI